MCELQELLRGGGFDCDKANPGIDVDHELLSKLILSARHIDIINNGVKISRAFSIAFQQARSLLAVFLSSLVVLAGAGAR
jgi:hypothetical protein